MKIVIYILFVFIYSVCLEAQNDLFTKANQAYDAGQFHVADSLYSKWLEENGPSATVYYNLGNTSYRKQQYTRAILMYERCLKYQPAHSDAKTNLALANSHLRDRIDPIKPPLWTVFWNSLLQLFLPGVWAMGVVVIAWLFAGSFILYRAAQHVLWRKMAIYSMLICLPLLLLLLAITFGANQQSKRQSAIITEPSIILKSEPNENSVNLLILHEGLKLDIVDNETAWFRVRLPDGNDGWLPQDAVEVI